MGVPLASSLETIIEQTMQLMVQAVPMYATVVTCQPESPQRDARKTPRVVAVPSCTNIIRNAPITAFGPKNFL